MPQFVVRFFVLMCSVFAAPALAQQAPAPVARPPAEDSAPTSVYRSAWSGYRPFADEKVISWRQANDEVLRIGGWRTYLRESQGGPSSGSEGVARPAPAASPTETSRGSGAAHHHGSHNASGQSR